MNPIGATGQPLGSAAPWELRLQTAQTQIHPTRSGLPAIVPNPLDNALIIQADAQQYQSILKTAEGPRRSSAADSSAKPKFTRSISADSFSGGVTAMLNQLSGGVGGITTGGLQSDSGGNPVASLTAGLMVSASRQLLATLNLQENQTYAHVISEPSLIATDSIPASINVGTQVPVSTGSTIIPGPAAPTTTQSISSQNTGVTLQVNARVNPSGVVTLIINQEISSPVSRYLWHLRRRPSTSRWCRPRSPCRMATPSPSAA